MLNTAIVVGGTAIIILFYKLIIIELGQRCERSYRRRQQDWLKDHPE